MRKKRKQKTERDGDEAEAERKDLGNVKANFATETDGESCLSSFLSDLVPSWRVSNEGGGVLPTARVFFVNDQ